MEDYFVLPEITEGEPIESKFSDAKVLRQYFSFDWSTQSSGDRSDSSDEGCSLSYEQTEEEFDSESYEDSDASPESDNSEDGESDSMSYSEVLPDCVSHDIYF